MAVNRSAASFSRRLDVDQRVNARKYSRRANKPQYSIACRVSPDSRSLRTTVAARGHGCLIRFFAQLYTNSQDFSPSPSDVRHVPAGRVASGGGGGGGVRGRPILPVKEFATGAQSSSSMNSGRAKSTVFCQLQLSMSSSCTSSASASRLKRDIWWATSGRVGGWPSNCKSSPGDIICGNITGWPLSKQYPYSRRRGNVPEQASKHQVYSVLHRKDNGCRDMTMNRDVNASGYMLDILDCELREEARPVAFRRQVTRRPTTTHLQQI
ncbi:hypothetical protein GQ600_23765 [Phytophthora cactorum]|nr:hypothetical protein GQ600_23765 [Phytophthora cactorum]